MARTRREEIVVIGDREITVKEIAVSQLLALRESGLGKEKVAEFVKDGFGIELEDLAGFYPSELEALWNKFKKVNSFFFKAAEAFGVQAALPALGKVLGETFGREFASLSSLDTQEQ